MSDAENIEVVRGGHNVFRDLDEQEAELLHMKAVLAGDIIHVLESRSLTVRAAAALTGFAAADFSRVRQAKVQGFSLDKLVTMLGKLDRKVELIVSARATPTAA